MIAAMSENRVIGKDNKLPWHFPDELKYFKKITTGKPIIMGRKTFESMGSRPLPNRLNIVLTKDKTFTLDNFTQEQCRVAYSLEEALQSAGSCEEVMIIGGAKIYEQFLSKASRLYLTIVHTNIEGDAFFPIIDNTEWQLVDETAGAQFTIQVLDKKS